MPSHATPATTPILDAPSSLEVRCPARGVRRVESSFRVQTPIEEAWQALRVSYSFLIGHARWIEGAKRVVGGKEEEGGEDGLRRANDDDSVVLEFDISLSRHLNVRYAARGVVTFDSTTRQMRMRVSNANDSDMVRFSVDAKVTLQREGEGEEGGVEGSSGGGACSAHVEAEVRAPTACGLPIPWWDAKFHQGASEFVGTLRHALEVRRRYVSFRARMQMAFPCVAAAVAMEGEEEVEVEVGGGDGEGAKKKKKDDGTPEEEERAHLDEVIARTCNSGGKMYRAFVTVSTADRLRSYSPPTPADEEEAYTFAWRAEVFQAFLLIEDDIMDGSEQRRGAAAWWKVVGMPRALNDGLTLHVLSHRLASRGARPDVRERVRHLLDRVAYLTALGQNADACLEKRQVDEYDMGAYSRMAKLKTAYYSFYEPVAVGILLARHPDEASLLRGAREVAMRMGEYYQRKDDFKDCFDERGKKGMDISDGKCTWLIVEAMRLGDEGQRETLRSHYGRGGNEEGGAEEGSGEAEEEVKRVYRDLELDVRFREWEAGAVADLRACISAQPVEMHAVWHDVLAVALA